MEKLNSFVEMQLKQNGYDNQLFLDLSTDELESIKELLKSDYGFLDVSLNFGDFLDLEELLSKVSNTLSSYWIIETYLCNKIIKESGVWIEGYDIKRTDDVLFSGDVDDLETIDFMSFDVLEKSLRDYSKENTDNGCARLHFFLDTVFDAKLQRELNNLIFYRSPIVMMGYGETDRLITYRTTTGDFIEKPHDYSEFYGVARECVGWQKKLNG